MTVEELIKLAAEWRMAQVRRVVYAQGTQEHLDALATIERVTLQLRLIGLAITTDDWANVVIQLPFKL